MEKPPELIYKYRPFNANTLTCLVRNRIWFASPATFNDPFDGFVSFPREGEAYAIDQAISNKSSPNYAHLNQRIDDEGTRGAVDSLKVSTFNPWDGIDALVKRRGVFCANAERDNILMWSHYADEHRGICVGYEFDYEKVSDYARILRVKPSQSDGIEVITDFDLSDQAAAVEKLLTRKSSLWSYEKEWRLILKEGLPESQLGCEKCIDGHGRIKCIIFGMRMPDAQREAIASIFSRSIDLMEARPAFRCYGVKIFGYNGR